MQLAIIIDNVTLAFLEVVQFGVARAAVSGLAVCLKVVTIDTNSVARLRVRSCWPVALIGAASDAAISASHALQVAVFIDDLSATFLKIVQLGLMPVAISGLAPCLKVVAMALDVFAALRVGAAKAANRCIATLITASRPAVNACDATQLAIVIHDFAAALVVIVQLGIFPVAARGRTAGFKIVTVCVHILAGLRVRATGKPRRNSAAFAAPQSAIVIDDVAAATLHVVQQSALPASGGILAICRKDVIVKINVPAGLLI